MAAGTLLKVSFEDLDNTGGTDILDTRSMYYHWWNAAVTWMNELNSDFALDDNSITAVTGLTPGTYYNRWLLPKTLTTTYSTVTECMMGPILATVVVAADGSIESITPTLKNGAYYAGETLRLMTDWLPEEQPNTPAPSMGVPSEGVDVVVATGSSTGMNIAQSKYWGFPTTGSWTSGKRTAIGIASGRQNVQTDTLYLSTFLCNSDGANGSTTWYWWQWYIFQGWNTANGRAAPAGSYSSFTNYMATPSSVDNTYIWMFYYNSTPGSECFIMGDTYYQDPAGWYKIDESQGFIGDRIYSSCGLLFDRYIMVQPYNAIDSDTTYGYSQNDFYAGITKTGFFKPMRNAESDNFLVGGGNENLYTCNQGTPMLGRYSTADGLVTFQKMGMYMAVRVENAV